jgi:cation diffusion facilitator family transporter
MASAEAHARDDAAVRRVLWVVLWLNLAVAVAKLAYGAVSGSIAIRADGIHSLFDGGSNIVGLVALWVASHPPDDDHPYGHRKVESLAALLIGVSVVLGLLEVVRSIASSILGRTHPQISGLGFVVAGGTLAINLLVSTREAASGRRLRSEVLLADARHTLGDSIATLGVLAGFIGVRMGYPSADLAAACVVSVMIAHTAWQIFRRSFHSLLDTVELDPRAVVAAALSLPGVLDCHAVRSRAAGGQVHVDLHIHVAPDMPVSTAHDLTHAVEEEIRRRFPAVTDVIIHTEPAGAAEP